MAIRHRFCFNNRTEAHMNGFEFTKSKCATDLWHTEYRLNRDPKLVRLIQPDAWRQQNNIKAPADGWVLPRRSFWAIVGPHNLRQPWSQPDIRLDGWPSGVCVMEWGASVTRLFFVLSLFLSHNRIPVRLNYWRSCWTCRRTWSSWCCLFSKVHILIGTQAAFLFFFSSILKPGSCILPASSR